MVVFFIREFRERIVRWGRVLRVVRCMLTREFREIREFREEAVLYGRPNP